MEFVCYHYWDQLPHNANEFFARAGEESIFFSKPWFENLIQYGLDEKLSIFLACVLEGDTLVALLPLARHGDNHYHSLRHLYTSLSTLLMDVEHGQQEILACLVNGLTQLQVDYLQLDPIAEDDTNLHQLVEMLESSGYTCQRYYSFYNWFHRTQGRSFADYMASRPTRVRNTIARKQRKLEREHGYSIRIYGGDTLQQGITDYHRVYNASWKAREQFVTFIDGLAVRFSEQGWLRLAVLYIDHEAAAAQFWFVANGKASIFKLVYDQNWKRYSPGSILTAHLMQHVIDIDQVEELDFLTGNDAYKQEWMSERRERFRLCCFRATTNRNLRSRILQPLNGLLKWPQKTVYN